MRKPRDVSTYREDRALGWPARGERVNNYDQLLCIVLDDLRRIHAWIHRRRLITSAAEQRITATSFATRRIRTCERSGTSAYVTRR